MDEIETKAPAQADLNELREEYEALRHLVVSILVLAVVVSGTLTIYLLRQYKSTHSELVQFRPGAVQMINDYQKLRGPMQEQFVHKLIEYGKTHPDFGPIVTKYGLTPATNAAPPATSTPPTAPKK
jgi:hypothetical protein